MILSEANTLIEKGQHLTKTEAFNLLSHILDNKYNESEIYNFLNLLSQKEEGVSEIIGFARAMREKMNHISINGASAIDVCGTGGSNKDRFNVSTASALLLASAGIKVAKHGNVGSSKKNGSFDFLDALNIPYYENNDEIIKQFETFNIAFCFARYHHPALKVLAGPRKALGKRTVFNLLGPLCNPCSTKKQIIGCTSEIIARKLIKAIQELEFERVIVIVGGQGIDELSPCHPSIIYDVQKKTVIRSVFNPQMNNIRIDENDITGGIATDNAASFIDILKNKSKSHPIAKYIILNAAVALFLCDKASTIANGIPLAEEILFSNTLDLINQLQKK